MDGGQRTGAAAGRLYAAVFFLVNVTYVLIWDLLDRTPETEISPSARRIMRIRSIATLGLFGVAAVVALRFPLVGLGICCFLPGCVPEPRRADRRSATLPLGPKQPTTPQHSTTDSATRGYTLRAMPISALDHIVLNVADVERSLRFYEGVLGLSAERVDAWRKGQIGFPSVRINAATLIDLVQSPPDHSDTHPNLAHFCLVTDDATLEGAIQTLATESIPIGPAPRCAGAPAATPSRSTSATPTTT